jgi:predicted PolB exonuclease-like 3'-5' exonuclease
MGWHESSRKVAQIATFLLLSGKAPHFDLPAIYILCFKWDEGGASFLDSQSFR